MLCRVGILLFFVGAMMGDSDSLYLPGLLIVLGTMLVIRGGGFGYDDEIDEN